MILRWSTYHASNSRSRAGSVMPVSLMKIILPASDDLCSHIPTVPASLVRCLVPGDARPSDWAHDSAVTAHRYWFQRHIERRMAPCDAARYERPAEMMSVSFQQQPTLPRRARGIEAGDDRSVFTQHFESFAHLQAAVGKHDIALHGPERVIRLAPKYRPVAVG